MQYKGEVIEVSDYDGTFSCQELEISGVETYAQICSKIDYLQKQEKEVVQRISIFKLDGGKKKIIFGTAGVKEKSRYSSEFEYYVSWKEADRWGKKREKVSALRLILDTPSNRETANKIIAAQTKIDQLEKEQDELEEKLITLAEPGS